MNPSFILFHAENVNEDQNSVCHLVLIPVINGERQQPREFFFNPEASFLMVQSGITESQVEYFGKFKQQWPQVQAIFDKFDMAVCSAEGYSARALYGTLERLNVPFKPIHYCNAKAICRRTLNEVSYSIDYLSFKLYGDSVYSDDPVAVAERWCDLTLKGLAECPETDLPTLLKNKKISVGAIAPAEFTPSLCKRIKFSSKADLDTSGIEVDADPENPFYGMNVVFTGKMSIPRNNARTSVIKIGGFAPERLTMETDYLVVGVQDLRVVGEKGLSGKMKNAAKYKEKGLPIEIIDEEDFREMIGENNLAESVKPEPKKKIFPFLTVEDIANISDEELEKAKEALKEFRKKN